MKLIPKDRNSFTEIELTKFIEKTMNDMIKLNDNSAIYEIFCGDDPEVYENNNPTLLIFMHIHTNLKGDPNIFIDYMLTTSKGTVGSPIIIDKAQIQHTAETLAITIMTIQEMYQNIGRIGRKLEVEVNVRKKKGLTMEDLNIHDMTIYEVRRGLLQNVVAGKDKIFGQIMELIVEGADRVVLQLKGNNSDSIVFIMVGVRPEGFMGEDIYESFICFGGTQVVGEISDNLSLLSRRFDNWITKAYDLFKKKNATSIKIEYDTYTPIDEDTLREMEKGEDE